MDHRRSFILVSIVSFSLLAHAGKVEKAFASLNEFNYFKAKEIFENCLKKEMAASSYGLSIIYARNDNPFYNLDSAYKFISIADTAFPKLNDKQKEKLSEIGVDSIHIQSWKDSIDLKAYRKVKRNLSVANLQTYITKFVDSDWKSKAVDMRDSLELGKIKQNNHSRDYYDFIQKYPNSNYVEEAKRSYEKRKFEEVVELGKGRHYKAFADKNPKSPYLRQAQDSAYTLYTAKKTVEAYDNFIQQNPNNPNVNKAWRNLYKLYTSDYSQARIAEFVVDYPKYPFINELMVDIELAVKRFLPFKLGGLWGYMDTTGKVMIYPKYEFAEAFSEGLALVGLNGKVGFIDKAGKTIIPFQYDDGESFQNGSAIVAKGEQYGIINRTNKQVIPTEYEEVSQFSPVMALVANEDAYGFLNKNKEVVVPLSLDYASEFRNGYALVEKDGKKGLINVYGKYAIQPKYKWLESFNIHGICRAKNDSLFGILDRKGREVVPFIYESIGEFHSGLALVMQDQKYGYINTTGELVIPIKYEYKASSKLWANFEGGYAKYSRKDKFGIVDTLGKELFPSIFEDIDTYYTDRLVGVKKRGKWGYSNQKLQLKIPYNYQKICSFRKEYAAVKKDTSWNFINQKGIMIEGHNYTNVTLLDNYYLVENKNWGLLDIELNSVLPLEFQSIKRYDDDLLILTKEDNQFYYSLSKKKYIIPNLS